MEENTTSLSVARSLAYACPAVQETGRTQAPSRLAKRRLVDRSGRLRPRGGAESSRFRREGPARPGNPIAVAGCSSSRRTWYRRAAAAHPGMSHISHTGIPREFAFGRASDVRAGRSRARDGRAGINWAAARNRAPPPPARLSPLHHKSGTGHALSLPISSGGGAGSEAEWGSPSAGGGAAFSSSGLERTLLSSCWQGSI